MGRQEAVQVAITGAAGQIGYASAFRIAAGEIFGPDQPVALRLLELESALRALEGVAMELDDCAFPLLESVEISSDADKVFSGVSWALLVGSAPRKAGMQRSDLLRVNGKIFGPQGAALARRAASDVRILVVGNPCNTNCAIAMSHAPEIPQQRWFSMTRLDANRARSRLAAAAGVGVEEVTNMAIWGNHSSTLFPDFSHARIGGKLATDVLDRDWLEGPFVTAVQERGSAIIEARGASSAGSAANAIIGTISSIVEPTPEGDWVAIAVPSRGEYGVPEGLVFGFPVSSDGKEVRVVDGLDNDAFVSERIRLGVEELLAERKMVADLFRS